MVYGEIEIMEFVNRRISDIIKPNVDADYILNINHEVAGSISGPNTLHVFLSTLGHKRVHSASWVAT